MTAETHTRRSPRLQHEVMVAVHSEQGTFSGWGTNLSLGGVFVNAPGGPPVGSKVDILLQLPGQPECKLRGQVAWSQGQGPGVDEPGMGIEFLDTAEDQRGFLSQMVERLARDLTPAASNS